MDIAKCIESLRPQLERHRKERLNEYSTRTILIDPLLAALGWDVRDRDAVELEHPTVDGKSVDYAMKINGKVVLHLEAKQLGNPLDDVKSITQVVGYAANDGIEWCVLTNGVRYRVYEVSAKASAPDKVLFEVSLDPADSGGLAAEELTSRFNLLSRDSVAKGLLGREGRKIATTGRVRKVLDLLLATRPPTLLNLIRKTMGDASVTPSQIDQALRSIGNSGTTKRPQGAESTDPSSKFSDFWTAVGQEFRRLGSGFTTSGQSSSNVMQVHVGVGGFHYEWFVRKRRHAIAIAFHCETNDTERNLSIVGNLAKHEKDIRRDIDLDFECGPWGNKWTHAQLLLPYDGDRPDLALAAKAAQVMKTFIERTWPLLKDSISAVR